MVVKTAWHAVVAKLGPLPPACKSLNNDELSFLHASLEQARRVREQELDHELSGWINSLPFFLQRAVNRLLGP